MNDLEHRYLNWLRGLVSVGIKPSVIRSHGRLFHVLYDTPFSYSIPMDGNRYEDGVELRYKFGDYYGISSIDIANYLDIRECSILEMMVALAIKIEGNIMADVDIGDRTAIWFWTMVESLGLIPMTDKVFDYGKVKQILETFNNRDYESDGRGSLFILDRPQADVRDVEIWMQAMWFLDEILGK